MKMKVLSALFLVLSCSWLSASTVAITADTANSTEGLGDFTGSIDYVGTVLTITLTNTSPAANGGYITGFAFNVAGNATATLSPNPTGSFEHIGPGAGAPPFGTFEAGAAMGGSWTGGGSPNDGIPVGGTRAFTFNVTGPDAASLTALDFISEPDAGHKFVVRFRGFGDRGSDKVPGDPEIPTIPLPAAVWSGMGMLGLLGAGRMWSRLRVRH